MLKANLRNRLIYSVFILLITIISSPSSNGQEPLDKSAQADQYQIVNADGKVFIFSTKRGALVQSFDTPKRHEIVVIDNTIVIVDKILGDIKQIRKIETK